MSHNAIHWRALLRLFSVYTLYVVGVVVQIADFYKMQNYKKNMRYYCSDVLQTKVSP